MNKRTLTNYIYDFIYGAGLGFILMVFLEIIILKATTINTRNILLYFMMGGFSMVIGSFIYDKHANYMKASLIYLVITVILMNMLFLLLGFTHQTFANMLVNNCIWLGLGLGTFLFSMLINRLHAKKMTTALNKRRKNDIDKVD